MATWRELQGKVNAYQTGQPEDIGQDPVALNQQPIAPVPETPAIDSQTAGEQISQERLMYELGKLGRVAGGNPYANLNVTGAAREAGYGSSRFDKNIQYTPGMDLEDARARQQSALGKIANGAMKGVITAGATAADTVVGTVVGAFNAFTAAKRDMLSGNPNAVPRDMLTSFIQNPVSQTLESWKKWSEEAFPNYRTEYERSEQYQREWYKASHFWSANNVGDSLLKNFGFTVGAMWGGSTWAKILGFGKSAKLGSDVLKTSVAAASGDSEAMAALKNLANVIGTDVVTTDANKLVQEMSRLGRRMVTRNTAEQLVGATLSAMGEGRMEALNMREELLESYNAKLNNLLRERLREIEQELLRDQRYSMRIYNPNDPGNDRVLTEAGKAELQNRKEQAINLYRQQQINAEDEADRAANLVFALNIPILTLSDYIQFGRILGGGWSTARNNVRIRGGLSLVDDIPVANYKRRLDKNFATQFIKNTAKISSSEAAEEMLQGTVSSGAQKIAENRLSYFNDVAYDPRSVRQFRDSFMSFVEGSGEYLGDIKNWQEGAIGAFTGIFGMPGRGYFSGERGGIVEAYKTAKEDVSASKEAAEKLNELVNSDKFRNLWKGWIRHNAFNDEIDNAVLKNDQYAYHSADDKQLINHIITFANAGRLDDLTDFARRYSNLSDDDIQDIKQYFESEEGGGVIYTEDKIKEKVESAAKNMLNKIETYKKLDQSYRNRLPIGVSNDILEEVVFTGSQIKALESRFLGLLDETINAVSPFIEQSVNADNSVTDKLEKVRELQREYAKIFGGDIFPVNAAERKRINKRLDELESLVKDEETKKKVQDMRKLMEDRQKFYQKLATLQTISNKDFADQAENDDKVVQKAEQQAAKEEIQGLNSLNDVRKEYDKHIKSSLGDATSFIDRIRKARKSNKHVNDFLSIYDTYRELEVLLTQRAGLAMKEAQEILDDVFSRAKKVDDMLDPAMIEKPKEYFEKHLGGLDVESSTGAITKYIMASKKLEDVMREYSGIVSSTPVVREELSDKEREDASRFFDEEDFDESEVGEEEKGEDNGSSSNSSTPASKKPAAAQKKQKKTSKSKAKPKPPVTDEGLDPSAPASAAPEPGIKTEPDIKFGDDGNSVTDALGNTYTVGDTVYYKSSVSSDSVKGTITKINKTKKGNANLFVELENGRRVSELFSTTPSMITKEAPVEIKTDTGAKVDAEKENLPDVLDVSSDDYADEADEVILKEETPEEKSLERNETGDGKKNYYQTAIPELPSEEISKIRNMDKDSSGQKRRLSSEERKRVKSERYKLLSSLKSFVDHYRNRDTGVSPFDKVWDFLISRNAFRNTLDVKIGDKIKFVHYPELGLHNDKPQMAMVVTVNGEDRIVNLMRMKDLRKGGYRGFNDLWNEFVKEYTEFYKTHDANDAFIFSKTSTVWGKRSGYITYRLDEDEDSAVGPRNRNIKDIQGYDEDAPIVYFNKLGEPVVVRGDSDIVDQIRYWGSLSSSDFLDEGYAGRLYYIAGDGAGGYIPVRLNLLHFTTENMNSDSMAIKQVATTIDSVQQLAMEYFQKVRKAKNDAERNAIINDYNELLHDRLGNLVGNGKLYIANKFFSFGYTEQEGANLSIVLNYKEGDNVAEENGVKQYDRVYFNAAQLGVNPTALREEVAAMLLPFDLEMRDTAEMSRNLSEYIENDLLMSNAESFLPKNVDIYIEPWNSTKNDFEEFIPKEESVEDTGDIPDGTDDFDGFEDIPFEDGESGGLDISLDELEGKSDEKEDNGEKPEEKPEEKSKTILMSREELRRIFLSDDPYEGLPQEAKDYLEENGVSKDTFNDEWSLERKEREISDCFGLM